MQQEESPQSDDKTEVDESKSNVVAFKSKQELEKALKESQALQTLLKKASKLTW